jgi:hypothetical protein
LYRIIATITKAGMDVPDMFRREVLSGEQRSFKHRVLTGRAWIYETGVRIGTSRAVDRYEQRNVQWVRENGTNLIDSWREWREEVRSLYKLNRDGKTVPPSAADRLLDKLKQVQKQCNTFRDRPGQEVSYLWTPSPSFERKLQSLARTLPTKVNALTVTMLDQLIGGLPRDWPDRFRMAGFQSNIHVLDHMNQYHERTIVDFHDQLSEWRGLDNRFQSARAYHRFRLRRLVAIPEAIRQLSEDGRILQLNKGGAMDNELRRASLRVLVRYARRLLKFHLSAYRDTAQVMDLVTSDVTSSGLRPLLEAVLLRRCRELYRALDVQVPESLTETTGSGDGSDEVLKQFNVLKKEAASPDGQRER